MNDYEDLLGRISERAKAQCLDVVGIFQIFCKKSGFINYADLRKILQLVDFAATEEEFELLTMFADESSSESVHAYDLAQQILNAELVAPQFELYKWIVASRELQGRTALLEQVFDIMPLIRERINEELGEGKPYECAVITGEQFQNFVRYECPKLSEYDVDLLAMYGIKGSRRAAQPGELQTLEIRSDLIQINHFEQALVEVVTQMRKEQIDKK